MKNKFLQEMQDRGYLNQCTNLEKLHEICNKKSISGYIGFDCTAASLHVGSLLQIMILKLMQKYGHRPIVLLGGGTTLIGDPSGKDSTRRILEKSEIRQNIQSNMKNVSPTATENDTTTTSSSASTGSSSSSSSFRSLFQFTPPYNLANVITLIACLVLLFIIIKCVV